MSRPGSVCCFNKRTVTNAFGCVLACIAYISVIYILLLVLSVLSVAELDLSFHLIGFLSVFSVVTTPVGVFGCKRTSYCALFSYVLLASYHLYGLTMYFWFSLKAPDIANTTVGGLEGARLASRHKEYEYLHYLTSGSYTALVALSILLAVCKIISLVRQLSPARVFVVDNTSE